MHSSKRKTRNLYLALTITGLILLLLWPSLAAAMPLTAPHQLERAWRLAVDIGSYHYSSTVVQTDHPTADLRNAGRSAHVTHVSAQGAVDLPNKAMSMKLWTAGIDRDGIEVKVENGKAYGRMNAEGGWIEISDPSQIFAPGGDPLGFLVAAENIREMDADEQSLTMAEPTLDDVIDTPHLLTSKTYQHYRFDINGVRYAEYVRRQLEGGLREQGELPPNITLGVIGHYVDMKGQGEIWIDDDGLPVQQVIRMTFPAERGALHWTENKVTTTFSHWDKAEVYHQLFWAIPRLVDDPTLLITDPLSLLPSPYALLPNSQWFTAANVEQSGLLLGLGLLLAALVVMVYTHRRSPQFYAGLSTVMVVLMLATPLLNANHALAFAERQQTRAIEQQQQLETQQQMEVSRVGMAGRDFNPLVDPLAGSDASLDTLSGGNGQSTPSQPPPARGRSQNLPPSGGDRGGANVVETNPFASKSRFMIPPLQSTCVLTTGGDCDNDGLADDIELYELGTDPEDVDTDNDGISDKAEVEGFAYGGAQWYLNPSDPDSNGDGVLDGAACPGLADVEGDTVVSPTGSSCLNSDSDSTPDVFDYDDDADGVPDWVDSAPLDVAGPFNATGNPLAFNLTLNSNGEPIFVDFEVRPTNPDHLFYTKQVLDWPDNDTKGQWTKNSDTTFADLDGYDSGDGDMMLNPLLEFAITYDAGNPTAGLPITNSVSLGSITDYSDLAWIDTEALSEWGISVNESDDDNTLLLWVPLNVIKDDHGETPVAWNGRMFYLPQTAQTTLGNAQTVRLVWMVEGIIDSCTAPSDSDYDTYCADDSHWTSSVQIMQTYYDEFTLTGLTVHEDHGGKLNIIAEPAGLGHSSYDDYLWHLADGLQETFLRGRQKPGGGRFSVDDIAAFATTWGVSGLSFTTKTLEDQRDLATIASEDNMSILNSVHASAAISDTASLLYAGEETNRIAGLSDDAASISGSSVSVDMTQVDQTTSAILRLSPFQYKGAGVWADMSLDDYQTALATDLESVFTDAQLDTLLAANGETITDYALARDGAISLAQGYALALTIGLNGLVELNGTDVNSDALTNTGLTLSGDVATTLVQHMLAEMQAYYAAKSVVTALAAASDTSTAAATALSAAFAAAQADILAALGSARQGDISSGLSLALQQLGNYYKTVDVDTGRFTDYASLSQQFYVSTVNSLDKGWGAVYSNAKYIWGLGNAVWGLKVMQALKSGVALVSANANILVKLWNSAKVWAVAGFVLTAAIALIMFLVGDYDNQLEYDAAAVKLAVSIVVYAIVAVITAIPGVGFLITGLVAAIDGLMALICQLVGVEPGSSFDNWFCNGITGTVIRALSLLFSDQLILVDLDKDDRLDVSFNSPAVVQKTNNDGYLVGNQLSINATITNTITLNEPTVGENLLILTSFSTSELKDRMRRSTFAYALQSSKTDHHSGLEWGDKSRWSDHNDTMTFDVSGSGLFSGAGINHTTDLYLTESYNVLGLTCGGFIFAFSCSNEPIRDSVHTFVGEDMAFDILPASLDGFRSLAAASDGGYRLAWDRQFPALTDADGDGVPRSNDPDDTLTDTDGDGLTDLWELDNGFDAAYVGGDGDGDGLTDYWEAFYGADPYLADTDNDGMIDGDEFFHTQSLNPYLDDDSTWTGGWLFTYDFDSSDNPLKTRVSASPLDADTDSDNVTDRLEFVYGYNPTVPQELNVLSLNVSAAPSLVAVGDTVAYTATVKNDLNSRTARGLLEAEFPVDTTQVVETFVLTRLQETTLNGTVTAPSVAQTIETSVTIRAGAVLEDPDAVDDSAHLVAQYQFNESQPTSVCTSVLNCYGSYSFNDSSSYNHDAVCEKDWGGSYSVDCPVANGAYLEFTGVHDDSPDYYTPVARIEAHDDFKLDSFSFEVWVKPTTQKNHPQNILNKYGDFTLGIKANSMTPFFSLQNSSCSSGAGSDTTINGSLNLDQNEWNQLMVTYNDDTNVLTLYVNGQSGGSAITTSCMTTGLNERITIGAMDQTDLSSQYGLSWTPPAFYSDSNYFYYGYSTPESFAFIGGMNKLQIFDADLSVAEIEDLYSKGNRVLEFKFDDPPGATTFDDASGNRLDGTCSGTSCPDSGRPGLSGQAVYFDGSSIFVPASSDTLGLSTNSYTVMAWLKGGDYNQSGNYYALLGTQIGVAKGGYLFLGSIATNKALKVATPLDTNDWHHVAWRWAYNSSNAANSTRTIFIDGVQVAQDQGDAGVLSFGSIMPLGLIYTGWLDNLVVVRSALSEDEIQADMNSSPLLSLHLDEDLNTTSFSDEAPANNPATCSGSGCPQAGADGWMREAPVFDGNDTLTVAAVDELQVTDFSLSMWVKPTKTKSSNQWLIRKDNSSGYNRNYALRIEPNSMTLRFFIQNSCYNYSAGWKYFDSQGELLENQWNSVIATYDNDRNEMALYINGALDTQYTPSYTGLCHNSQPITIGQGFEGSLDEVAVYGGRLSSLEVQDIYDYQSAWYDTVQQVPVIIDAAPPAITLGNFTALKLEPTMLAATVVDDDSYLSRIASVNVTITPPAGGGSAYTESASGSGDGDWLYYFSPTVTGQYTIQFAATDSVGNSASASALVTVDNTPPTVEIDAGLLGATLTTSEPITGGANTLALTGTFSDGGSPASGVVSNSLTIDIRDWQGVSVQGTEAADATGSGTWQVDYPFVSPPYGQYEVQAQAEDAAGNVMSGTIGAIALDALGPTADVVAGTVVISSAMPIVSGTVMDVPFSGNSRRLHLHFEESAPPFVDGSLRQANATCSGSECPAAGQSGRLGLAADFDGGDVLTTVNILDPAATSFTAMAWFNLDSAAGTRTILSERDGDGTGRTWLAVDNGRLTSELGGASLTDPTAVGAGGWHHAAATYDGSLLRLYLDGTLAVSATRTIEAADGQMVIGANKNEGDHFSGRIDELAIYDRAFSADEIYIIANPLDTGIDSAQIRL
ncbi:MAG: hypothetical protein KDI62_05820, partial [Anaerolineae bacterium]|nr:hypothetical protein [Anaerolineae bacterium]